MTVVSIKQYTGDNLGIGSVPLQFSSAVDVTLSNPCPSYVQATFTATGHKIILPAMNATNSLRVGESIVIENYGFNAFDIDYADGTTNFYSGFIPGQILTITLSDNSTANGVFTYAKSPNPGKILQLATSGDFQPSPNADWGKTFVTTTDGSAIRLTLRSGYPDGFWFSFKNNGEILSYVYPTSPDRIDGLPQYSMGHNACVTIFNNVAAGTWSVLNEKVGSFNEDGQYVIPELEVFPSESILVNVGYSGKSNLNFLKGVSTTDATVTTLDSIVVEQDTTVTLQGTIAAHKADVSNACGGNFNVTARRATGGNITLIGSPLINMNSTSTAFFTCDVDVSTQSIRIRVTGIAATDYYWITNYSYQTVLTTP